MSWEDFQKRLENKETQQSGSGWDAFQKKLLAQESGGGDRNTVTAEDAYRNSGMDALRRDVGKVENGLADYFSKSHRANAKGSKYAQTQAMLGSIRKEREYFDYYANAFTPEQLQGYYAELAQMENTLTGYGGLFADSGTPSIPTELVSYSSGYAALSNGIADLQNQMQALNRGNQSASESESQKNALLDRLPDLTSRLEETRAYLDKSYSLLSQTGKKQDVFDIDGMRQSLAQYKKFLGAASDYLSEYRAGLINPYTGKFLPSGAALRGNLNNAGDGRTNQLVADQLTMYDNAYNSGIGIADAQETAQREKAYVEDYDKELLALEQQEAWLDELANKNPALLPQIEQRRAQIEQSRKVLLHLRGEHDDIAKTVGNSGYSQYVAERMANEPDFEEKSKYQSTKKEEKTGFWHSLVPQTSTSQYGDVVYDMVNGDSNAFHAYEQDIESTSEDATLLPDYLENPYSWVKDMTKDEVRTFNYLYAKDEESGDAEHTNAYRFLNSLEETVNARRRYAEYLANSQYASEHPVLASVESVARSPLKAMSFLGQAADYIAGKELDPNAEYNKFSNDITDVRSTVAAKIAESGAWGEVGSFGYQLGMSMGDSLMTAALSGGKYGNKASEAFALGVMGSGAAADTVIAAKERGASDNQAFWEGVVVGAVEIFTEKISLEALFKGDLSTNVVIQVLKQAATEAIEEGLAGIADIIADIAILQNKGEWAEKRDELLEKYDGNTTKAFFALIGEAAKQIALDSAGGAISGGIMSGGNALVNAGNIRNAQSMRSQQTFAEGMQKLDSTSVAATAGRVIGSALDQGKIMKPRSFKAILALLGTDKQTSKRIRRGQMTADEIADAFARNHRGARKGATQAQTSAMPLPSSAEAAVSTPTLTTREARIQAYLESGMTKEHAQYAADVLERAVNGEDLTNADIRKLRLATKVGAKMLSEAFGVEIEQAKNNKEDANRVYREAEFAYRTARNAARYGDVEFDVRALPATQESADAVLANPKAKAELSALLGDTYSGNYKQQSDQIIRTLRNWWLGAYKTHTPESAQAQAADWRNAHPQNAQFNIDNAAKIEYTGENGGDSVDRNGMDSGMADGVPGRQVSGGRDANNGENGRTDQVVSGRDLSDNLRTAMEQNGVVPTELYDFGTDTAAFSYALAEAIAADPDNGWCVSYQTEGDLKGKLLFMDKAHSIGFAITADGDIEAVFKNKSKNQTRRALDGVMPQVIALGGMKLDCYGAELVRIYEKYGFVPVARVEFNPAFANDGWNESKGTPDIFFMIHNGDSAETVAANIGKYEHMSLEQLEALPYFDKDGYDDAYAYRDSILEQRANEKSESGENGNSVGAAESGFDPYTHAANEYGTIEPGENPARIVDVPQSTDGTDRVSKLARTAMEAGVTTDSAVQKMEQRVMNGDLSYEVIPNEDTRQKAEDWLNGFDSTGDALLQWNKTAGRKRFMGLDDYANGIMLYCELMKEAAAAQNRGDTKSQNLAERQALDVFVKLRNTATQAGQLIQINRMFKQLTPNSRVLALQDAVAELNSRYERQLSRAGTEITIDPTLQQQWVEAMQSGDRERIASAEAALYHDIATQVPSTWRARLDAYRHLCMLGNPKTVIRNFFGNAFMVPAVAVKNKIGALMERALPKEERTKYLGSLYATQEGREILRFAGEEFAQDRDTLFGTGKYGSENDMSELNSLIRQLQSQLPGVLGTWQNATDWLMNNDIFGDGGFLKRNYALAFANAARARGFTAAQFRAGAVSNSQVESIRAYAVGQALKATFRDVNAFSNMIKRMRFHGDSALANIGNAVIEGYLPYKATPANIAVRAVEYSPIGILRGVYDLLSNISRKANGRQTVSGAQIIEELSAGLSGTAVLGLGYLLASLGVLHGASDDDDDREGIQSYSITLNGENYTLDWLAPASVPLFVGVSLCDAWNNPHESALDAISDSLGAAFAPLLEMSMLSGFNDLLETMTYGIDNAEDTTDKTAVLAENLLFAALVQPFLSLLGQMIPTLSSQVARSLDANSEYTYTGDIEGRWVRQIVKSLAKVAKKIPGVNWRQYEYVDEWGRTESNGAWYERIFNNFLNPAYVSDVQITDVDAEIDRLQTVTGIDAAPTRRGYTITVNKVKRRLSGEEYERYAKTYGEEALKMMTVLMASSYYAEMSDTERVSALEDILDVANEYGKHAALPDEYEPSAEDKLYNLTQTGLSIADAYAAKIMRKQLEADPDMTASLMSATFSNWVSGQDWPEEQKQAVLDAYGTFYTHIPANSSKYDALSGKIGGDLALSVVDVVANLAPRDGSSVVTEAQKISAIAAMPLTDNQKWSAFAAYKTDWRMAYFRDAGINPSVYAAYLEAIPRYRISSKGTKSSQWTNDTIYAWLATTPYSSEIKQKVAQIATMKKPEGEGA